MDITSTKIMTRWNCTISRESLVRPRNRLSFRVHRTSTMLAMTTAILFLLLMMCSVPPSFCEASTFHGISSNNQSSETKQQDDEERAPRRRRLAFENLSHEPPSLVLDYGDDHPFDRRHKQRRRRQQQEEKDRDAKEHDERLLDYSTAADDDDDDDELPNVDVLYSVRNNALQYTPLRIHFDTTLLQRQRGRSAAIDARIDEIINVALPRAAQQWQRHLHVVPVRGSIDIDRDTCFGVYGKKNMPATPKSISNADLVVIVGGENQLWDEYSGEPYDVCQGSTLALASACTLDQHDRPVIGFMNWCVLEEGSSDNNDLDDDTTIMQNGWRNGQKATPPTSKQLLQENYGKFLNMDFFHNHDGADRTAVAVHELGHIFGFISWMYKYFREPDGTPRTPRPFQPQTVQCTNGIDVEEHAFIASDSVLKRTDHDDGRKSYSLATPRVLQTAANHLNCHELQHEQPRLGEGEGCIGSHWHERFYFGEIMSPSLSFSSENVLSPLTLALMEDSGWYRVDYRNVETPTFGLGAGCDFLTGDCIENDRVPDWGGDMFCDAPIRFDRTNKGQLALESLTQVGCDPSHQWWSVCDLWDEKNIPSGLQTFPESSKRYFSNANLVSSFSIADSCPIPVRSLGLNCAQPEPDFLPFYKDEEVGPDSKCINASWLLQGKKIRRPACMQVRCDTDLQKAVIVMGSQEAICRSDGEQISLDSNNAVMECPRLAAVCPQFVSCPAACSGRGVCLYDRGPGSPVCECEHDEHQLGNTGCYPDVYDTDQKRYGFVDGNKAGANGADGLFAPLTSNAMTISRGGLVILSISFSAIYSVL